MKYAHSLGQRQYATAAVIITIAADSW